LQFKQDTSRMFRLPFAFFVVVLLLSAGPAHADADSAFHARVNDAYGGYRAATSYMRTGNPGLASLEIAGALDTWREIMLTYGDTPTPSYARDPHFSETLSAIGKKLETALSAAENGDAEQAGESLSPVRDMMYDLRKRNGVRLYADCITELNRAVEPLYKHRHAAPDLGNSSVRRQLVAESETYAGLLEDCRGMAPAAYAGDAEFIRLFDGTRDSIQSMFPAIDSGDPNRVINILRELRSFDRIIYFRFGD